MATIKKKPIKLEDIIKQYEKDKYRQQMLNQNLYEYATGKHGKVKAPPKPPVDRKRLSSQIDSLLASLRVTDAP